MEFFKDPLIIRQLIMQHFESPDNKICSEHNDDKFISKRNKSTSCIDDITMHIKIENNKIVQAKFSGEGCTISSAASDMLANIITNKTIDEALEIVNNYINMIQNEPYNQELLQELNVFANVYKQPNRKACALNGVDSIKYVLLGLKSEK